MSKLTATLLTLALLTPLWSCSREPDASPRGEVPGPIIIISVDTLRADRLPAWGYDGVKTPAIDSLIRDGIRFSSAWSHVPLTLPSHASLFTGMLPGAHGVRDNLGYELSSEYPTIATELGARGYDTAGMVSAWVLRRDTGIANGFDVWDEGLDLNPGAAVGELQRDGQRTVDSVIRWLDQRGSDTPFFLFVHLFDPHTPYAPPEPFASMHDDPYDGEIAAVDASIGRLLEALRSSGDYDEATIIFLSDHGEGLGDHGEAEHGIFLYREAIHIPMVLKLPGGEMAGTTVDEPAQIIDVHPTILGLLGEKAESGEGRSLIDLAEGRVGSGRRIFSETMYPRLHFGWSELSSLTDGDVHVIEAPRPELYRMKSDPEEKVNRVESERRLFADYREEIERLATPFTAPAPVSAEAAAKLTALGYLGSGPSNVDGPLPDPKDRIGVLDQMKEAWTALHERRIAEAIRGYEEIVEANPLLSDAWVQLSIAYERAGALDEAVRAAQRAIQITPSLGQGIAITIARLQLQLGDLGGAAEHAELARPVNPGEAGLILARVALARDDLPRAESLARSLVDDASTRARAAVILAQIHIERDDYASALALIEPERKRLLSAGQPLPSLMEFARGDALVRLGRIDEGIAAFRSEIERHPGDLDAYSRLAAIHVLSGRVAAAESVLGELVKNNPGPRAYDVAATTWGRLGRPDLAEKWRRRKPS